MTAEDQARTGALGSGRYDLRVVPIEGVLMPRKTMRSRRGSGFDRLEQQGLCLCEYARVRLTLLAARLGDPATAAGAARGLCLLVLELSSGAAGRIWADAALAAAADPSPANIARVVNQLVCNLARESPAVVARPQRKLRTQGFRIPDPSRAALKALLAKLPAGCVKRKASPVLRGLCMVGLEMADGAAGPELAEVFGGAAAEPTLFGVQRAIAFLNSLQGAPSTIPDPPGDEPAPASDSSPPSTLPSRAA